MPRVFLLSGILLVSCDSPEDYFKKENRPPEVLLKSPSGYFTEIHDMHKMSLGEAYICTFKYQDDQRLSDLTINYINGSGEYLISDSLVYYSPDTTGQHILEIEFYDPYESSAKCRLNLEVFWNLKPEAVLEYTINNTILTVNASGSYDQDADFGGEITNYRFILDGVETNLLSPIFTQNINPSIIHVIKLQVRDNDGEWSALISDIVPVQ